MAGVWGFHRGLGYTGQGTEEAATRRKLLAGFHGIDVHGTRAVQAKHTDKHDDRNQIIAYLSTRGAHSNQEKCTV